LTTADHAVVWPERLERFKTPVSCAVVIFVEFVARLVRINIHSLATEVRARRLDDRKVVGLVIGHGTQAI
jgi:hypothetical protein